MSEVYNCGIKTGGGDYQGAPDFMRGSNLISNVMALLRGDYCALDFALQ